MPETNTTTTTNQGNRARRERRGPRAPVAAPDPADRRTGIDAICVANEKFRDYVTARGGEKPKSSLFDSGRLGEPFNDFEEGELIRLTAELHRSALMTVEDHDEEIARLVGMISMAEEIDKMACRILGRNIRAVEVKQ
ncbi:hypothetical protein [Rhodobacter xanthinilyticus]|nr:hypothetical protein [Rhodobacter xanthinilyticus]